MNIYISKATEKDDLLVLGNKESELAAFTSGKEENDYLAERIKKEKSVTVLNHFKRKVYICILKEEDKTEAGKYEEARKCATSAGKLLADADITKIIVANAGITQESLTAFVEGLALSSYSFRKYFTQDDDRKKQLEEIGIDSQSFDKADADKLRAVVEAVAFTRDLVNEPLSYLTAEKLAEEISEAGRSCGFSVEIFNKKKIESLRMGGLLAVNKGSVDPPTFTIMEWKPENATNDKPYVFVGKGVVYDTGGLSLKPTADSMDYMKCDMAGAAAVAGLFHAVASTKLPVWIIGLVPATDNRPDGNAYVPGDVIEMYNGSTVEVLNTDAEGRMILADALSYAKQYDPELVIDLATLTGAAHFAIGHYGIVAMGNAEREVMDSLKESGERTYERLAEFPFWDEYAELLKSDIADMKNIGGRVAGAITAGKFLEKFTDYPYIHLDIAGPSYNKKEIGYMGKGGSGVGVRLLFDYLDHISK